MIAAINLIAGGGAKSGEPASLVGAEQMFVEADHHHFPVAQCRCLSDDSVAQPNDRKAVKGSTERHQCCFADGLVTLCSEGAEKCASSVFLLVTAVAFRDTVGVQGFSDGQREMLDAESVAGHLVPPGFVFS